MIGAGYLSRYSDGIWAGRSGFDSEQGQKIFLLSTDFISTLRPTLPPIQWVFSPELSRTGCEADHSPPSSAEASNNGSMLPLRHTFIYGVVLN
jgi:hypothetical protein